MKELKNLKYVILEIIPTNSDPKKGDIAQISALKLDGFKLIDRFDYRLDKDKINVFDILKIINYDNDKFKYLSSTRKIKKEFKKFIGRLPLLIIDNSYTYKYLEEFNNEKIPVFDYLNLKLSDTVFDEMIKKYNLEASNYLVDLLYEALIMEYN
mgnify:CR=1 FL=1